MKIWKTLALATALTGSSLIAGETTEHIIQPYVSYTTLGMVSCCPHLGIRWQKDMFMMDANVGGRYFDKTSFIQISQNINYIFNPGSDSQNYFGVSGKYILQHNWYKESAWLNTPSKDMYSAAASLVFGKDFTMAHGKKIFVECHYTPWMNIDGENSYPHLPELKLGVAL